VRGSKVAPLSHPSCLHCRLGATALPALTELFPVTSLVPRRVSQARRRWASGGHAWEGSRSLLTPASATASPARCRAAPPDCR
jgi:hypothetical protein